MKPVTELKYTQWQRFVDNCNRHFDALFDRSSYTKRKYDTADSIFVVEYTPLIQLFLFRLLILPILCTVYVASRLGLIVLNPLAYPHNPAKAGLMLGVTLVTAGAATVLALTTSFFSAQTMVSIAGSVGGGAAVLGLVGMVAFATLLHGAKTVAQRINRQKLVDTYTHAYCQNVERVTYVTAPKHHVHVELPTHSLLKTEVDPIDQEHKTFAIAYYNSIKRPACFDDSRPSIFESKRVLHAFDQVAKHKTQQTVSNLTAELKDVGSKDTVIGPIRDAHEALNNISPCNLV